MTGYRYETEHYEFSWCGTNELLVKLKNEPLIQKSVKLSESTNLTIYEKPNPKNTNKMYTIGLRFKNFKEAPPNEVSQKAFKEFEFEKNTDQREQLLLGFRYFVLAVHYKLLVPTDIHERKIILLNKDYLAITQKMPSFNKELEKIEKTCAKLHISEPLVGLTGFMAYDTEAYTWMISEANDLVDGLPEYEYVVDRRLNKVSKERAYLDNGVGLFQGSQKNCIARVMEDQCSFYGVSLEMLVKKRQEAQTLNKMIEDLEIVLHIPKEAGWHQRLADETKSEIDVSAALDAYKNSINN